MPETRDIRPTKGHRYDAFISYSHQADALLAKALETHLERFAKPWYRLRAANIFRDETSLTATPHLWSTIVDNLDQAAYLIVLASTTASDSKWVRKEICHWITDGGCDDPGELRPEQIQADRVDRILLVLTEGEIVWDDAAADFDWARTTALPGETLTGAFLGEPLWVDLRWTRDTEQRLDRASEDFMHAVAKLSAPIRNLDIESLIGEDYRQHRRSMRHALIAIVALILLAVAAGISATGFYQQWTVAEERATNLTIANGYRLIQLGSEQLASWNTEQAATSFAESQRTFEAVGHPPLMAWHRRLAADLASLPTEQLLRTDYGSNVSGFHVTDDGRLVALVFDYHDVPVEELRTVPAIEVWDTADRKKIFTCLPDSEVGRQVSRFWNEEAGINHTPEGEVVAVLAPCDVVLRKSRDSATFLERLSLRTGSRTTYVQTRSPEEIQQEANRHRLPLNIEFQGTTLQYQPRHAEDPVSFSGFFGRNPANGNDKMYADPFGERPDRLQAESYDGSRLLVGTYEGTVALFECHSYGQQLRRGKIGAVRGIKYAGKSRIAYAVDEEGRVFKMAEDHRAMRRNLVPDVKVNIRFGDLGFSPDGSVLAGCGENKIFAYSLTQHRLLGIANRPKGYNRLLAFGHDPERRQVFALVHSDVHSQLERDSRVKLCTLEYRGSEDEVVTDIVTLSGYKKTIELLFVVGCFDFDERLVWVASATSESNDGNNDLEPQLHYPNKVQLRAYSLDSPGEAVRSKVVSLDTVSELCDLAYRDKELHLLASASGAPGLDSWSPAGANLLVTVPTDGPGEASVVAASGLQCDQGVLDTWLPGGAHAIDDAKAITHVRENGTELIVAVTEDGNGIALCTKDPARDLFFRTRLPLTGLLQDCALSHDGRRVALATYGDEVVLIDLGVYERLDSD